MIVSPDDITALLGAEDAESVLVLIEGRTQVVPERTLDSEQYAGALRIITRDDLEARLGAQPSEHDIAEQAATLDTAVSELGG
jgi:hypothetical protein